MISHVKTLATLSVLVVMLLAGIAWGWSAMTTPFPHRQAAQVCLLTKLQPGERVSAPKVTVSVYNASQTTGLAERTMTAFENQGFGVGDVGNAPAQVRVPFAQVWNTHPNRPDVRLVLSRLGPKAHVVAKHYPGAGIVVMVGPNFNQLVPGTSSVKVTKPVKVCSPPTG